MNSPRRKLPVLQCQAVAAVLQEDVLTEKKLNKVQHERHERHRSDNTPHDRT